jgi:hypothetical protein
MPVLKTSIENNELYNDLKNKISSITNNININSKTFIGALNRLNQKLDKPYNTINKDKSIIPKRQFNELNRMVNKLQVRLDKLDAKNQIPKKKVGRPRKQKKKILIDNDVNIVLEPIN